MAGLFYETPDDCLDDRAELLAALMAARARRWRRRMARRLDTAGDDWNDAVPSAEEWEQLVESLRRHLDVSARDGRNAVARALRDAGFNVDDSAMEAAAAAAAVAVGAIMVAVGATGPRITARVAEAVNETRAAGGTPREVVRGLGLRGDHPGPLSDDLVREWGRTIGRAAVFAGVDSVMAQFPGTKEWVCTFHNSRQSHIDAHGQTVALSDPFLIGGWPGRFPHDPNLPAGEVINCRCYMRYNVAEAAAVAEMPAAASTRGAVVMAADADERRRGIMVSVEPTDEQRSALAALVPSHVPEPEMHVTLAYCGSVTDIDDPEEADRLRQGLRDAISYASGATGPLDGHITATTTLGDDDPPAQVGLVDSVGLGRLRALLADQIAEFCPEGFLRTNHDFLAHITLRYSDDPLPPDVVGQPLTFGALHLHWGDDIEVRPLHDGGDQQLATGDDPGSAAAPAVHSGLVPYSVSPDTPGCDGYAVVKDGTDDVMGCHHTKGEAEAQRRALYANEEMTVNPDAPVTAAGPAGSLDSMRDLSADTLLDVLLAGVPDEEAAEARAEIAETLAALPRGRFDTIEGPDGADEEVPSDAETVEAEDAPAEMDWQGPLVVEGRLSGDRRVIAPGALSWRDFPLPLMLQKANQPQHLDSVFAGNIWRLERRDDGSVWGYGTYDDSPDGAEAKRLVDGGRMRGVSVDMDRAEAVMAQLGDLDGVTLADGDDPEWAVEVYTKARVMGVTMTPFPAFQEAYIEPVAPEDEDMALAASGAVADGYRIRAHTPAEWTSADDPAPLALVASGALTVPRAAPAAWFDEPRMDGYEYLSIDDDGRISGLVCDWQTAHIGHPGRYVTAPRNPDFSVFYGKRRYETAEGQTIRVGPIIMDTVHPDLSLRASDAQAFYAHTGCIVGAVRLYANRYGIAAAGTLLPGITEDQKMRLQLSDVSPDWRPVGRRGTTVCAVLAVPLSGFPSGALAASGGGVVESLTPRVAFDAHGEVTAMVAVGAVRRPRGPSVEDRLAALEVERRRPRVDAALARMGIATAEEARAERVAAAVARLGL